MKIVLNHEELCIAAKEYLLKRNLLQDGQEIKGCLYSRPKTEINKVEIYGEFELGQTKTPYRTSSKPDE